MFSDAPAQDILATHRERLHEETNEQKKKFAGMFSTGITIVCIIVYVHVLVIIWVLSVLK